jgi:tetratricopeptide (TPR) repeat protein
MRGGAFDPPALPDGFWDRHDVRQALAERKIGALFRLLIKPGPGMLSQMRIATATELTQGRVSMIARDLQGVTSLERLTGIATGLGMPDHARVLFGVAPRQAGTPPAKRVVPGSEADQAAELLRRISNARYLDASVIEILQDETNAIRLLDRRLGAAVVGKLDAHIGQLEDSLRHSLMPGRRKHLALVLADAAALAGWQAIDTGRLATAWSHFETATAAAREAGDSPLLAFAAGEQAYVLLDLGEPTQALEKVRAVHGQVGTRIPRLLRGWLHAAEAEMAAMTRQQDVCRIALDHAADEIGHPLAADSLPYLALNGSHLARWRGSCLVHFGDPATIADLTDGLAGMDGTFTRAEAGLRCDLAAALHATGERDEARAHLSRATELAQLAGSARQRRRIIELRRRIGRPPRASGQAGPEARSAPRSSRSDPVRSVPAPRPAAPTRSGQPR